MEIKSYKAEPSYPIAEKNLGTHHNSNEAADHPVNKEKKLLVQKSSHEVKPKSSQKKVKEGNENKAPKKPNQNIKEPCGHAHKLHSPSDPEITKMKEIEGI